MIPRNLKVDERFKSIPIGLHECFKSVPIGLHEGFKSVPIGLESLTSERSLLRECFGGLHTHRNGTGVFDQTSTTPEAIRRVKNGSLFSFPLLSVWRSHSLPSSWVVSQQPMSSLATLNLNVQIHRRSWITLFSRSPAPTVCPPPRLSLPGGLLGQRAMLAFQWFPWQHPRRC